MSENIMLSWLLTTPDSAIAIKYVDLEESSNIISSTKKRNSSRARLSHEENNRRDKAKHGMKGRRKEESYKAFNYESKQKALMRAKKMDDIFDDITKEEADRLALLNICEEKYNALFDKYFDMSQQRMDALREIRLLSEEMEFLEEDLKLVKGEMEVLENYILSLK